MLHDPRYVVIPARHCLTLAVAVGTVLYDRAAKFGEDLAKTGRGLKTAVDAYNSAVGSFERRFLPMGQKLENLKVTEQARRELVAPERLGEGPRGTTVDDLE